MYTDMNKRCSICFLLLLLNLVDRDWRYTLGLGQKCCVRWRLLSCGCEPVIRQTKTTFINMKDAFAAMHLLC